MKHYREIIDPHKDAMIAKMLEGDSRCTFKINDRVEKCFTIHKDDDIHRIGETATIKGSCFADQLGAAYLVHFDNDPEEMITFIMEQKLKLFSTKK